MSAELVLVIGIVLAILSMPAMVSAIVHHRSPRRAAIVVMIAGGLVVVGAGMDADGFQFSDVPRAFAVVIASIIR